MTKPKTLVLALGGNSITRAGQKGSFQEQLANIAVSCSNLVEPARQGFGMVITHGNGPQVGSILMKNDLAKNILPPMPLDVAVANTQGSLGFAIQTTLENIFRQQGIRRQVICLITRVEVDAGDPAFNQPTKPVGPFYNRVEAEQLTAGKNYIMREDSGRGWRRVVPSPKPIAILEKQVIEQLVCQGVIVIAAGGGGIPVVRKSQQYAGVEAVVDKDLASCRLAEEIGAEVLVILTGVPQVYVNYRKPDQRPLDVLNPNQVKQYLAAGEFPAGSMGPKMAAAAEYVEQTGGTALITDFASLNLALAGSGGTTIKLHPKEQGGIG